MPIYEYRPVNESSCSFCADGFEILRKISDPDLTTCPQCGTGVYEKTAGKGPNVISGDSE